MLITDLIEYSCGVCNQSFETTEDLQCHIELNHEGEFRHIIYRAALAATWYFYGSFISNNVSILSDPSVS